MIALERMTPVASFEREITTNLSLLAQNFYPLADLANCAWVTGKETSGVGQIFVSLIQTLKRNSTRFKTPMLLPVAALVVGGLGIYLLRSTDSA